MYHYDCLCQGPVCAAVAQELCQFGIMAKERNRSSGTDDDDDGDVESMDDGSYIGSDDHDCGRGRGRGNGVECSRGQDHDGKTDPAVYAHPEIVHLWSF